MNYESIIDHYLGQQFLQVHFTCDDKAATCCPSCHLGCESKYYVTAHDYKVQLYLKKVPSLEGQYDLRGNITG